MGFSIQAHAVTRMVGMPVRNPVVVAVKVVEMMVETGLCQSKV
jgi:Asp/Glu/hydantoin racemase